MTPEQKAAYVMGQAACLIAEVLGMHAENMQREHRGESMAYTEKDFDNAIGRSGCHHNSTIALFHDHK